MKDSFKLREVNISGGKMESMNEKWMNVPIRLKYLKQLNVDVHNLITLEIKQISNHSYIEHEWD